ncbi:MAG: radical SAM protein [Elusimicrobiota bacterium]
MSDGPQPPKARIIRSVIAAFMSGGAASAKVHGEADKARPAFITLTYGCQCRCEHCGVGSFRKKGGKELTTDEVKRLVLDGLEECGLNWAYFFGGEPTTHKDFVELVRYSTEKGLFSRADTNGIKLADKGFVKAAKDAGMGYFLVSLDSVDPKIHDRFRGMRGTWEKAVRAIKNCVEMRVPVGISTVVTKESLRGGDTERIIRLGKELGAFKMRLLTPMLAGRWRERADLRLSKEEKRAVWSLLEPDRVFWEDSCDGTAPPYCESISKGVIAVTGYGDVQPCWHMPIRFGNVRKEPLKAIVDRMWSSAYFKRERLLRFECPMNDADFRGKIERLTVGKRGYPVDYDENVFGAEQP